MQIDHISKRGKINYEVKRLHEALACANNTLKWPQLKSLPTNHPHHPQTRSINMENRKLQTTRSVVVGDVGSSREVEASKSTAADATIGNRYRPKISHANAAGGGFPSKELTRTHVNTHTAAV